MNTTMLTLARSSFVEALVWEERSETLWDCTLRTGGGREGNASLSAITQQTTPSSTLLLMYCSSSD